MTLSLLWIVPVYLDHGVWHVVSVVMLGIALVNLLITCRREDARKAESVINNSIFYSDRVN